MDAETEKATSELVRRAERRDEEAFAALHRAYAAGIFRLARVRLGSDVEDVVAETFVRAWKGLPRFRPTGDASFSSWLYGICRNVIREEQRARGRSLARAYLPEEVQEGPGPDGIALRQALARLSEEHRQILELKYLLGFDNAAIGAALGKSPGAVNAQRWRALQELKAVMER